MFSRLSIFHLVVPLVSSLVVEDDSVNLLQTTVHKHQISGTPSRCVGTPEAKKNCVVKGDPHIKLWSMKDSVGAPLGLYGTYADYWLVHTDQLKVMGRVGGTNQFDMGVVKGTAISGSLLNNKVLIIPSVNGGPVTFDGKELNPKTDFPFVNTPDCLNITVGDGPNWNSFGLPKHARQVRHNTYTITIGSKAVISLNQDVFQHMEVMVDESVIANDKGMCQAECKDWFRCQGPICNINDSLFTTKHPECGFEILRVPCNPLRHKLAKEDCVKEYGTQNKTAVRAGIQNCIEDCCSARDQCPDRGVGDGKATCLIFGDPHIKGFDATAISKNTFSPIGTHWLVKSDFVKVQANYNTSSFIKAQIEGIAFAGALVSDVHAGKNKVIYFRHKNQGGGVDIDGKIVMEWKKTKFYSDPDGHFNITMGKGPDIRRLLKDRRPTPQVRRLYTLTFYQGAKFLLHQLEGQSIYMSIDSRLLSAVSGECGNFNGDPSDDGHLSVAAHNDDCVPKSEFFIPDAQVCQPVTVKTSCNLAKKLKPFMKQCRLFLNMTSTIHKMTSSSKGLLKSCMQDCCLGGTCPKKNKVR